MSYTTYITEALVCGSYNQGGADRSFRLFTREHGMLSATARSVREERSRQRYALQDFSRIRVALVKGKADWRIGSVEVIANDFSSAKTKAARGSVVKLYRLLRRYIQGEDAHLDLFDFCVEALACTPNLDKEAGFFDVYLESRILSLLGYVEQGRLPADLIGTSIHRAVKNSDPYLLADLQSIVAEAHANSQL